MYFALALLAAIFVSLALSSKTNDQTLSPTPSPTRTPVPIIPGTQAPTTLGPVPASITRMPNWTPVPIIPGTPARTMATTLGPVPASITRMPNSATTLASVPVVTMPDATVPRSMKRTTEYACSRCSDLGAQMCCAECHDNQQLAAKRAAPFNAYAAEEVLCTACDEIMNRPTTNNCTIATDGRFYCSKDAKCIAEPEFTYEDIR